MHTPQSPKIISGEDIGFRFYGVDANKAIGQFMVKVDGEWLEAASTMGDSLLQASPDVGTQPATSPPASAAVNHSLL